jgi:hypothetical protein
VCKEVDFFAQAKKEGKSPQKYIFWDMKRGDFGLKKAVQKSLLLCTLVRTDLSLNGYSDLI